MILFERRILDLARVVSRLKARGEDAAMKLREALSSVERLMLTPHLVLDIQLHQTFSVWWWLIGSCLMKARYDEGAATLLREIREECWPQVITSFEGFESLTSVELMALLMADTILGGELGRCSVSRAEDVRIESLIEKASELVYPAELWRMLARCFDDSGSINSEVSNETAIHLGVNWSARNVDVRMTYSTLLCLILLDYRRGEGLSLTFDTAVRSIRRNEFIRKRRAGLLRLLLSCYCSEQNCFSGSPFGEPHAGYVFCTVGCLVLLEASGPDFERKRQGTIRWLQDRFPAKGTDGLCNGRSGKDGDVCYCFWVLGTLSLLGHEVEEEHRLLVMEGLKSCERFRGVYSKASTLPPDIFHSYFGQLAMELLVGGEVSVFCGSLTLSREHLAAEASRRPETAAASRGEP